MATRPDLDLLARYAALDALIEQKGPLDGDPH